VVPPGEDDLITDDGEPMESERHREQASLLLESLRHHWRDRRDFYAAANMGLYFSETQVRANDFRAPDLMVVLDTTRRERKAWVVWMEDGRRPDLALELLSESTRDVDRGVKKRIYERLGVSEYFLADPFTLEREAFRLAGNTYHPIAPDAAGRLASEALGLLLGTWDGEFNGLGGSWLRWFTPEGRLVSTAAEDEAARRAEAETRRAEAETRAAEEAERAEALARRVAALEKELRRR
jgi:Uma2 family endonuclease